MHWGHFNIKMQSQFMWISRILRIRKFFDAYSLEEGIYYIPYIIIRLHSTISFRWVQFNTCKILKSLYSENALQMIKGRNTEKTPNNIPLSRNNDFTLSVTIFMHKLTVSCTIKWFQLKMLFQIKFNAHIHIHDNFIMTSQKQVCKL